MKNNSYLFILICLFSCGKDKDQTASNEIKPLLSIVATHKPAESIKPIFTEDVEDWQELEAINSFLEKFTKTSPNEALSNALELRDLVKSLKDSVTPAVFDIPSFKVRVNVFNNEVLRLADLTTIPAIKAEEINVQVNKTIAAFSAVNSKINTIISKKRFEDAIDLDLEFIGIDATKIDDISKKSIQNQKKQRSKQKYKKEPSSSKSNMKKRMKKKKS